MQQHRFTIPIAANGNIQHDHVASFWDLSPPYSPRYDLPTNNDYPYSNPGLPYYHQPHANRPRQTSHVSYLGHDSFPQASNTPESTGSSTTCHPNWAHNAPDYQGSLNNSSDSEASYTAGMGSFYNSVLPDQVLLPAAFGSSRMLTASDRDLMEQDDLIIPSDTRHDSLDITANGPAYTSEDRYLGAYWLWVHPLYPVVHRPSFRLHDASPLLKAAMLALGAHALGDPLDKTNARYVHERCMKVLKKVSKVA